MSAGRVAVLGAIAGVTIFLGLPFGRLRALSERGRGFVSVVAAGILLFIFWDVLSASRGILESSLAAARSGGSWVPFAVRALMGASGLAVGALALGRLERWMLHRRRLAPMAGGAHDLPMPGSKSKLLEESRRAALALGMLIAIAIGLHNFSEGLAIGVSARAGAIGVATTLVVGFALHNATEGFGIIGPLAGVRPSWRWLCAAGVIGGGPTFIGTLVGYRVTSQPLEISFYTLAGGAILFVVGQIWPTAQRRLRPDAVLAGLVCGILLGFGSDLVIAYGGG